MSVPGLCPRTAGMRLYTAAIRRINCSATPIPPLSFQLRRRYPESDVMDERISVVLLEHSCTRDLINGMNNGNVVWPTLFVAGSKNEEEKQPH